METRLNSLIKASKILAISMIFLPFSSFSEHEIFSAISSRDKEKVEEIVKVPDGVDLLELTNEKGQVPLVATAEIGDIEIISVFYEISYDAKKRMDLKSLTQAIEIAKENGKIQTAKYLEFIKYDMYNPRNKTNSELYVSLGKKMLRLFILNENGKIDVVKIIFGIGFASSVVTQCEALFK